MGVDMMDDVSGVNRRQFVVSSHHFLYGGGFWHNGPNAIKR